MPHPIPAKLNLLLLCTASVVAALLLYAASHAPLPVSLAAALLFGLAGNTLFALLHESVHGVLLPGTAANRWAGRLAACWFPTGWTVQRAFHLNHHRRNRSPSEQFDTLRPQDVRWLKYAQWYAIFTGLYWPVYVSGVLLYSFTPPQIPALAVRLLGKQGAIQSGAEHYIGELLRLPLPARLEIWAALLWQATLFRLLDLQVSGWLLCYGMFGLMWGSLQYTDHAFSPLNRRDGAWNLRVPKWLRAVFLNYHLHLAHHQHPEVPWNALPAYADRGPRFWDVWLACWRGPKRVEDFPTFKEDKIV